VELSRPVLIGAVLLVAVLAGPWAARAAVRLAKRDGTAVPSVTRVGATTALLAALLAGSVELLGLRPATAALAWAAGAAVVLGSVDLLCHRLPDRVTYPAVLVCAAAFLVDAAVLGTWGALLRAVVAAVVSFGVGVLAASVSPDGFGFGDVKLLGLLGLVLGWFGWGVLMTGVFLGLLTGALVSLLLLATRRAGWRTAIPFGPPLLAGAVLTLALGAVSLS
jgi:leader peptidase (prepilin peptidase) / N-methyltransferase